MHLLDTSGRGEITQMPHISLDKAVKANLGRVDASVAILQDLRPDLRPDLHGEMMQLAGDLEAQLLELRDRLAIVNSPAELSEVLAELDAVIFNS